jgi:hypothetical protein
MPIPATTINYPLTTFHFTNNSTLITDINASYIVTPSITPGVIVDSSSSTGSNGQYLTCNANSSLVWTTLPGNSLGEVLTKNNNASGNTITNLLSLNLIGSDTTSCTISSYESTLNISTNADISGSDKSFSRAYLPISVAGVKYYLPLFS